MVKVYKDQTENKRKLSPMGQCNLLLKIIRAERASIGLAIHAITALLPILMLYTPCLMFHTAFY